VRIRLFVTVLCLECDRQCGHFHRNTVKNNLLALDWNVTVPVEQIGPISYIWTALVLCGYETRPSWVMIRRRVDGQQHCTSWYDVVKASNIITYVFKQNLQKTKGAAFYITCEDFVQRSVVWEFVC
jgi:hypothetical protein